MIRGLKRLFQKHKADMGLLLGIVLLYAVMFFFGITCPIKYFTGISCPGCGFSRACLSALRLDFASAFYFHPLWITLPVFAVLLAVCKIKKWDIAFTVTLGVFCILMLSVFIFRMIYGPHEVVCFAPDEGLLAKLLDKIPLSSDS